MIDSLRAHSHQQQTVARFECQTRILQVGRHLDGPLEAVVRDFHGVITTALLDKRVAANPSDGNPPSSQTDGDIFGLDARQVKLQQPSVACTVHVHARLPRRSACKLCPGYDAVVHCKLNYTLDAPDEKKKQVRGACCQRTCFVKTQLPGYLFGTTTKLVPAPRLTNSRVDSLDAPSRTAWLN